VIEISLTPRLQELAETVKKEHALAGASVSDALAHALAAGTALIEAKAAVAHGEWLVWLKVHATIPERTAQRYMGLAEKHMRPRPSPRAPKPYHLPESKSDMMADLTAMRSLTHQVKASERMRADLAELAQAAVLDEMEAAEEITTRSRWRNPSRRGKLQGSPTFTQVDVAAVSAVLNGYENDLEIVWRGIPKLTAQPDGGPREERAYAVRDGDGYLILARVAYATMSEQTCKHGVEGPQIVTPVLTPSEIGAVCAAVNGEHGQGHILALPW